MHNLYLCSHKRHHINKTETLLGCAYRDDFVFCHKGNGNLWLCLKMLLEQFYTGNCYVWSIILGSLLASFPHRESEI